MTEGTDEPIRRKGEFSQLGCRGRLMPLLTPIDEVDDPVLRKARVEQHKERVSRECPLGERHVMASREAMRQRRLHLARLLAERGPMTMRGLLRESGLTYRQLLKALYYHGWFIRAQDNSEYTPWRLTEAGRLALQQEQKAG